MITQTSALIIYIIVILAGRFFSQSQRKNRVSLSSQLHSIVSDPSALTVMILTAAAIGMPIVEFSIQKSKAFSFSVAMLIGLVLIITGSVCAYSANKEIGEYWSPVVEKTQKQNLVTSGIYGIVRHPLYLSGLLILVGTNIYFGSKWSWAIAIITTAGILCRIPIEERHLTERFGEEYMIYKQKTKAILPWIF